MAANRFRGLFAKVRLTDRARPKKLEDRVATLEMDVRDLRSAVRKLIEVLEAELARDLDRDQVVGRVGSKRVQLKKARLAQRASAPTSRIVKTSPGMPLNLP